MAAWLNLQNDPQPIIALQNDPPAYDSLWLLDSIYKMTPQPILALQNDPQPIIALQNDHPAYNSIAKCPPGL